MIGIEVNNTFLELGDESVRFEKINPSFITDLFQGDFSFPFTVTDTDTNLKALGFSNVIELVNRTVSIDCYIWMFGIPYTQAKIIVSAGTKRTIKINIAGGVKAMKIADKNLQDLHYGADYNLGLNTDAIILTAKNISLETDYTVYGFTFVPHKNEDFYGTSNPDFSGIINRQDSTNGNFLKNSVTIGNKHALVPWLYLFFILKTIFEEEGLIPDGDFWNDPEMHKVLLYNNYALDSPNNDDNCYVKAGSEIAYNTTTRLKLYKGPPTTFDAAGAWSNSNFEYTIQQAGDIVIDVLINAYTDTRATYYFGVYEPHFNLYIDTVLCGQVIFPSQTYGESSISLTYSYTASIGDIGKKIYLVNKVDPIFLPLTGLIFNVHASSYMLITNSSELINIYSNKVSFKNHVKDITVAEFLSELKNLGIALDFDYNNGLVKLNYDKNYINAKDCDDWTGLATDDYELNFEDKNKGFKVNYNFGSADKMVETNFKTYLKSNFKGEFKTLNQIPSPSGIGFIVAITNSNQLYISAPNATTGIGYIWKYFSDYYYDIVLGNGEKEYKIKIAPMFMDFADNEGGTSQQNRCLIPISKQSGSSQMYGIGLSDFDLRFVFLRGVNQLNSLTSPQGGVYVYAGTSQYGINGNYVGNYEFNLNSKKGLIDIFILDFLKALTNADIVERDILLNELGILKFNVKNKVSLDGSNYLIKSLSILGGNILKMSRTKMLKL